MNLIINPRLTAAFAFEEAMVIKSFARCFKKLREFFACACLFAILTKLLI
jgi:hypothetical protein